MNKNPDSDLTLKSSLQGLDPANYSRSNFTRPLKNATTVYFGYIFKCFKYFLFFIVFLKVDILLDIGRREYSGAWQYQPTLDNRQYRRTLTIHPTAELEVVNWRLLQSLHNRTGVFSGAEDSSSLCIIGLESLLSSALMSSSSIPILDTFVAKIVQRIKLSLEQSP